MGFLNESGLGHLIYKFKTVLLGQPNGVAPLDSSRKVPVQNLPYMTGTNGSSLGLSGIVPTPNPGDEVKFLRGDGTWAGMPVVYTASDVSDPGTYPNGTIWLKQKASS